MSYLEGRIQRYFKAGTVIFREGDYGASMYIITSGEVEVSIEKDSEKIVLANLPKGSVFGEMALLDQPYRSATVTALTDVSCLEINNVFFKMSFQQLPSWMRSFFQILVERVRESNKKQDPLTIVDKVRQIVMTINLFRDLSPMLDESQKCLKWQPVAKTIQLLLNVPEKLVEIVFERLVEEEIIKKIVDFKEGRLLKIVEPEKLAGFATFCQEQIMRKMNLEFQSAFQSLNAEKQKLLEFLRKLMHEQPGITEFEAPYLEARCQELLGCDWGHFSKSVHEFSEEGLITVKHNATGERYYQVDKSKILGLREREIELQKYASLEQEIVYAWEKSR